MKDKIWQSLKAGVLLALLTGSLAVPASGGEPPKPGVAAPSFEEATSAERLRHRLREAIDDFEDAANAAIDEVTMPDSGDDLCAEIAAQWGQQDLSGLVPSNDNSEEADDSSGQSDDDTLVVALSILKGPWSPPGLEDGHDLFFVYRIDAKGHWAPAAVCIRAGPTILTMKPERTQLGVVPNL